ncbi:MAG TPA: hypothetical protein VL625_06085 [Patescibacteria group bacterium]|jgi:hypothetical protein|nr:hypothetical protein [Patescibacteria group bacterium]
MGSLQDGDVHGEDVAVDGYIWKWEQAVNGQNPAPATQAKTAPSGGTGMLQDGEVHGEDVGPEGYITKWYAAERGGPK